ncbi:MAG: IS630 family transposase [Bacteroidetes bacterium]|nr:IS630 family transposase [Bacteroidota bacterium]
MENIFEDINNSDSRRKKQMNTMNDMNKVGDYNPNDIDKPTVKFFYIKLMIIQKYMECIVTRDIVMNIQIPQIEELLGKLRKKLIDLIGTGELKYKIKNQTPEVNDRIARFNAYLRERASYDSAKFVMNPKYYPKRSKIDLVKLKERIITTGLAGTSLKKLGQEYGVSHTTMHKIITKNLGFSYKVTYPLNVKAVMQPAMNSKLLYLLRLYFLLEDNHKFIYMDESSFNNHRRCSRRWVHKRTKQIFYDYGRIKSISLMMAISAYGVEQYFLNRRTNKASHAVKFINKLSTLLSDKHKLKDDYMNGKVVLVLDNAKIHKTDDVKDAMKASKLKILFLPPYSPMLNPIELVFNVMKKAFYNRTYANQ